MAKIFRFQLRHHACLIKPTLLQLHHCTSLTALMFITRAPLTIITRDPLTFITRDPSTSITRAPLPFTTRAHYIHDSCSKLTLFHSNILFHYTVFIYLHIQPVSQLTYLSPTFPPFTHKSDSSPISKHIWNASTLLLLSNDVEINPEPQPIDQNPVFCCICSNKINRRVQQEMAPTCSVENCNTRCHQACNGLSIHQICHGENSGRSITWKCPQHGTGIAEIFASLFPVYEIPSLPSAVGKSCSVCKNPIWTHYADLAYHCANPSCNNVCHLAATCSSFVKKARKSQCFFHSSLAPPSTLLIVSKFKFRSTT